MIDKLLTTRELESLLHLDRVTIYRMVKDGELPAVRVGGQWRFSAKEINAWLVTQRQQVPIQPVRDTAEPDLATLSLPDLIPLDTLQQIQNQFSHLLGVSSFTIDLDGKPLAPCSRCSRFCQLIHSTPAGVAGCEASWRQISRSDEEDAAIHACHAGIQYATAPVVVNGQRMGMVTAGQFRTEEPDPARFREQALATGATIGVDGEALADARDSIEVVSEERALQITDLLATIANTLSQIGYQGYLVRQRMAQIAELSRELLSADTN